jgi:nitrate/nitrite transporter NarK
MYRATVWFDKERLSFVSGLTTALGFLGAVLALKWIPHFAKADTWQNCWFGACIFGILSLISLDTCVPPNPVWERERQKAHFEEFTPKHAAILLFALIPWSNLPISFLKTCLF